MQTPADRRTVLWSLLGRLPDRDRPIGVLQQEEVGGHSCHVERLLLDLNGLEPVSAWFVRPRDVAGPVPVILYTHAHGGDYALGKDEFLRGRRLLQNPPYAEVLTQRGWAGLCIDLWGFGERSGRSESSLFKSTLWQGQVLWGMMVYDTIRALDYLVSRPDVDAGRIGALGLSMGSTMSWWVAALDERIRVCVDLCCLTDFTALLERNGLDLHGLYYYVPDLLTHFSTATINDLIVPRPHLGLAGTRDPLTPPAGLDRIDAHLRKAYAAAGAPDAWELHREETGHQETPAMREKVFRWLERWL